MIVFAKHYVWGILILCMSCNTFFSQKVLGKASSQHDAATTMIHSGDSVLMVMGSVGVPLNMTMCQKFQFWSRQTIEPFLMLAESRNGILYGFFF